MKLGLWLLIAVVAFLWFNHARKQRQKIRAGTAAKRADTNAIKGEEPIVACAQCGVHVPLSESSVSATGTRFCSEAHRLQHSGT